MTGFTSKRQMAQNKAMNRPLESDYTSQVAYTRALEAYCDTLAQPVHPDHIVDANKMVQPVQEPVAYMSHNKENFVSADDVGNSVPNWTDYYPTPLYVTPQPCPTCVSLARAVMMDSFGRGA